MDCINRLHSSLSWSISLHTLVMTLLSSALDLGSSFLTLCFTMDHTFSINFIENVWSIMKQRVKKEEPKSKAELKSVITKVWREIDQDKELCKRLMQSIPKRLQAIIDVGGRQITKIDYD